MMAMNCCVLLVCFLTLMCGAAASSKDVEEHAQAIIEWIKSIDGGVVHEKLEVRRDDLNDPESFAGVYATGDIRQGQILMVIPQQALITAGNDTSRDYGGLWCPTVLNLVQEMKLGDESKYAPYVNYLLDQPHGQLPSGWSASGQELLREVIGQNDDDDENDLPPEDATGWIRTDWYKYCNGTDDPLDQHAALLLVQRGWDDLLIPIYDLMSHRNGKWLNSECDPVHHQDKNPIVVRASRDISGGDQIYSSYNLCTDCGARQMGYGTSEILRDYGFVEQYPQRWFFSQSLSFELDEDDDSGNVYLRWLSDSTVERGEVDALLEHVDRLREMEEKIQESVRVTSDTSIPERELSIIATYVEATVNAMTLALRDLNVSVDDEL